MHRFYPKISNDNLAPLRLIKEQMKNFPDYLSHSECPYDPDVKDFLSYELGGQDIPQDTPGGFFGEDGDKWSTLENKALGLYQELELFGSNIRSSNTSEKMSYFRTKTQLLDKITSINERAMGLRQLSQFQQTVIDVMDEVLNEDQRTDVMARLKQAIGEAPKPEDFDEENGDAE